MSYWNARSVANKTASLYDYLSNGNCDLLILTETWLRKIEDDLDENKVTLSKLLPDGFQIKHTPRPDWRIGGGVAVIFSDTLSTKVQTCFTQKKFQQFESMSIRMNLRNTSFYLTVIYRPPPSQRNNLKLKCFWKDWSELLSLHARNNSDFIIVGDLNLHLDVANDHNTLKFNSLIEEFNLKQHIQEKTHVQGHTLDILITNSTSEIASEIAVFDPYFCNDSGQPVKDHFMIKWHMKGTKKIVTPEKFVTRDWKNLCHNRFNQDLTKALSESISQSTDLVKTYFDVLEGLRDEHVPLKTKKKSYKLNPWYSDELRAMKTKRRQLERKWIKSQSSSDNHLYKQQCYEYYKCLRKTIISYNRNLISENNSDQKKLHSIANKLLGNQSKVQYPECSSIKELADSFMNFFINKVKGIREELPVNSSLPNIRNHSVPQLSTFEIATEAEILRLVQSMANKHCKLDPVPTWVLKKHLDQLIPLITKIINQSLETGIVHPLLKSAIIRPILKNPNLDHTKFENFRPVSNLPFLAKVLEKVVYTRLNNHLTTNHLLQVNQSAYKKYHSTETVMIKIQNDILTSLDKDKVVALVTLDISAAFDTVDQHRLLNCFNSTYGLSGTVLQWMKSYLSNRTQRVLLHNCESFVALLEHGFPQGAVLAGILYNMYSSPLHTEVESHPVDHHSYADDNNFYIAFSIKNKDAALDSLQDCLGSAKNWLNTNLLQVNDDKTKVIYFTPRKDTSFVQNPITVGAYQIFPTTPIKYLGIHIDSLLNLEIHINKLTSTAYFYLRNISKIRKYLDTDSAKSLVQSVVVSRIDYCNSLLSKAPQRLTNKLQRVQNHAARIIYKKKKRDHITPVLKELHWLPVRSRIDFKILLLTYKCLIGVAPLYLRDLISYYSPPRNLRSNTVLTGTLVLHRFNRLKHGGRAFSVVAPQLWNRLPTEIRNANTVLSFKSMLKTHLFRQFFE